MSPRWPRGCRVCSSPKGCSIAQHRLGSTASCGSSLVSSTRRFPPGIRPTRSSRGSDSVLASSAEKGESMKLRSTLAGLLLATGLLAAGAAPVQGANISVQPYGLSFGPQRIGTASTPRTLSVVLSSSYGAPGASFSGLQIADPGSLCAPSCAYPVPQPDFGATTDCPTYVAGSASCHIYVTFHPAYPPSGPRA